MRVLLTTWGSSGDLHPFLALGAELVARGHTTALAGNPAWREVVESTGIEFIPAGPEQLPGVLMDHPELFSPKNLGINSLRTLMEHGIKPVLRPMLQALVEAAPRFDVLVAHHFALTAGSAAEITGIPWVTVYLAPGVIPSAYSMPAAAHFQAGTGRIWRTVQSGIWSLGRRMTAPYVDPVINEVRAAEGLKPLRDALFGHLSPRRSLLLYSKHFAPMPPDYSPTFRQAGFCYWNGLKSKTDSFSPPAELTDFLNYPQKPWLFTLGTSAVTNPDTFYSIATDVMRTLPDQRAILLLGHERNRPAALPPNVLALPYLPYSWIMPKCSVVAHQCGIGTLSHTLRAGIPSLACPFAFDQPNNAARLEALGIARRFIRGSWSIKKMRTLLLELEQPDIQNRAKALSHNLAAENGPAMACEILEKDMSTG
ncbi:MAG: glycosyltransferase [Candidatus Methylacidiphilales bacterium]|nr:glycosyltransferase [Candidatus Methylacidiphilales bacterium]